MEVVSIAADDRDRRGKRDEPQRQAERRDECQEDTESPHNPFALGGRDRDDASRAQAQILSRGHRSRRKRPPAAQRRVRDLK
jgi:hypothetical protein